MPGAALSSIPVYNAMKNARTRPTSEKTVRSLLRKPGCSSHTPESNSDVFLVVRNAVTEKTTRAASAAHAPNAIHEARWLKLCHMSNALPG